MFSRRMDHSLRHDPCPSSSTQSSSTYGYHGNVDGDRCMPLLRDMSYEELPASRSVRPLPDVCDQGRLGSDGEETSNIRVRPAQYGGSFTVAGTDQAARSEYVRSTIHRLQVPTAGTKPVLLVVSLEGIKVCSLDGKDIYMSHALRRISYATCDPGRSQFSFLAREPRGHLNLQYCHTFFTDSADKAEELNTIVGNAFRMAYAAQLQRSCLGRPPSASEDSAWDQAESRNNNTADKTVNRTRSRHSSGRTKHREALLSRRENARGKNVNLTSDTSAATAESESSTTPSSRLAPEVRRSMLGGYVNEAMSTTDTDSRSSEGEVHPLAATELSVCASQQSLAVDEEDTKSCRWSSCSSAASSCQPAEVPSACYQHQLPFRLQEEAELRAAAWFQAGIPREIALEVLAQEPVGAFMVRESTTKHGCYALSLRVPRDFQVSGIAHYLILKTAKGYKIKGFTKEFATLTALITHHSVMPELLPCTLSLSRYNPSFGRSQSSQDLVELDSDTEYNGLSELSRATTDTTV